MDGHLMPSQIEDGVLGSKAAREGGAQMTSLPALVRKEKKEKREKNLIFYPRDTGTDTDTDITLFSHVSILQFSSRF